MLVGHEIEERVRRLRQHLRDGEVELPEELIGRSRSSGNVERQGPAEGGRLEGPTDKLLTIETLTLDVTVGFGCFEECAAKLHPFRIFEVRDVFRADGFFPKFGVFQLAHEAGTGAATDKIEAFPPFAVGAFVEQEIAGRRKPFIIAERPPLREVVVDLALDALVLLTVQVARFDAEIAGEFAEDEPREVGAFSGSKAGENGLILEGRLVPTKLIEALVADVEQFELIEVGIIVAPTFAQVADQAVADDEPKRFLRLF